MNADLIIPVCLDKNALLDIAGPALEMVSIVFFV
jgi:hypothetical protein